MKSIDKILGLSDDDYRNYLRNLLHEEDSLWKIDELDDELLKIVEKHSAAVERLCRINSTVFIKLDQEDTRNYALAYNFNTQMIAAICQNNIPLSKSIFIEGITFCRENQQFHAGQSLSNNIFKLFASNQVALDEAPYFLKQITGFFNDLGKYQDAIEAMCAAATYFADVSAFQSAYRTINDAQEIAITQNLPRSQLKILETQGTIALIEGDLSCASLEFQNCFNFYQSIGEEPPFQLSANAALVKLRQEDYEGARDIYQILTNSVSEESNTTQINQIKTNLLVCYRELDEKNAAEDLSKQIELCLSQENLEERIEARLILAKTYFHLDKLPQGTCHLRDACIDIQSQIDQYHRLHYRRGVREQYASRIKSMITSLEDSGIVEDVLHALMFCSSNALHDWLSVLEWIDHVLQSTKVPASVKEELLDKRESLICYGTPFMYGFREKYDEPLDECDNEKTAGALGKQVAKSMDYSLPWREFNELAANICQAYFCPSPFEGSSIQNGVKLLSKKLSSGSAFLFSFACEKACVFVFLAEGKYIMDEIPQENLRQFYMALFKYQRGHSERNDFHTDLIELQKSIKPIIGKIVGLLEISSISELVFVPDHLTEALPLLPNIIESEQLRSRIKKSEFVIRTCPAIKEESTASLGTGPNLFVSNSEERLELAETEKTLIKKAFENEECFEIDLHHEEIDFSKPPTNAAKLLHLATHSIPANTFTDPFFVSTSTDNEKNDIWLESVQREAHKLNLTLVFLNGCNTGATNNRNYFKIFLTNEKVGLSSGFLLNRRCTVIATQWNEPEIVGFIFASLFYKRLANNQNAAQSFIITLVDLFELSKNRAISLCEEIRDERIRQKCLNALEQSQDNFPFRNTYFLGMFQCHSLLMKKRMDL